MGINDSNITNPKVLEFLNGFYRPVTEELGELRLKAEEARVPVILRDTENVLRSLLLIARPLRILEIGTAVGYSASFFAEVCGPDSKVVSLELKEETAVTARENIRRLGYESQITVITGDAAKTAAEQQGPFDLVFIDAAKSHYLEYWNAVIRKVVSGGLIICDNILMSGRTVSDEYDPGRKYRTNIRKMNEFLSFISETEDADTSFISAGDGMSVSIIRNNINGSKPMETI